MRLFGSTPQIANTQYQHRTFVAPKTRLKTTIQLGLLLLFTFLILRQLDSDFGSNTLQAVGSTYSTFFPSYTDQPVAEESGQQSKQSSGKSVYRRPLFGFVPLYVAVMSLVILFVVTSGFTIMYLYHTGQLR